MKNYIFLLPPLLSTFLCTGVRAQNYEVNVHPGQELMTMPMLPAERHQPARKSDYQAVMEAGSYTVTVTDTNGCVNAASFLVREFCPTRFYAATAFSPNADGINNVFRVETVEADEAQLSVFDCWGNLVFTATPETPVGTAG